MLAGRVEQQLTGSQAAAPEALLLWEMIIKFGPV
jgi:hypothetical protein